MRKKILPIITALCLCFSISACSGETLPEVSIYDLQKEMLSAGESLPEMLTANGSAENAEELFAYFSDMDYSKVSGFFLAYAADGSNADEIAVIAVKDISDAAEAKESLERHKENRVKLYDNYLPEQVGRAENGIIFTKSQYAVLIIAEEQDEIKAAFENFVEN